MTGRRRAHPSVVIAVAVALLLVATPVSGKAGRTNTFTLHVTDTVAAGDADALIVITIRNTSSRRRLDAVDVGVPAPFTVAAAPDDTKPTTPSVLELRDLDLEPGASRHVDVTVDVRACTAVTSDPFTAVAKDTGERTHRRHDFRLDRDRSDLTVDVDGTCGLAFVAQPGDAEIAPTPITSVDYDPDGAPITVEVRDAADTGRATHATPVVELTASNPFIDPQDDGPIELGGTTSATVLAGLATFEPGPTLSPSASEYTLSASTDLDGDRTDDATTASAPFDIVDDQVACPAGEACAAPATAELDGQRVIASFGPGANAASLVVSLGAADVPDFTCAGVPDDRATAEFRFVGGDASDRTGTVTLVVPNPARPPKANEVCWAASYPFTTDDGTPAATQGTKPGSEAALHVGVLPDCARWGEPERPCVSDRTFRQGPPQVSPPSRRRGPVATIVVQADGRDPWARS